jgi:putative MFS transporter
LPALLILVIRSTVPESPRYLIAKGRLEEARAVVERVEKAAGVRPPSAEGGLAPKGGGQVELKELFSPLFRNRTVLLWILWFCMSFTYYAIFTWLPTALSVELRSVARGLEYTLIITLAQIPGYLSAAYLVERAGRKPVLTLYLILTAVSAYFFGAAHDELTIRLAGSVMSFFNLGAWGVLYTYTPELYPTRARGTGAGAASAVGRVGAILAPLTIIALTSSFFLVFALSAVLFAIGSVAVLTMGEETRGRTLEEISKETA